jgi:hypothetical protein
MRGIFWVVPRERGPAGPPGGMGGSPPLEESGLAGREVVRGFVVISYSLTTPSAFAVATARHPSTGGELPFTR